MSKPDVIVVGAGLAGAVAARNLADAGYEVLVLEGRDRVGGRALARAYCETGPMLEFGGAWITPWHEEIRNLVERFGLYLRPRHPITQRRYLYQGGLHERPYSGETREHHDGVMAQMTSDAGRLAQGFDQDLKGRPLKGLSFADYMIRLGPPEGTRALLSALWVVSGNANWDQAAASEFLAVISHADKGLERYPESWVATVSPSMSALVRALFDHHQITVHCTTTVKCVVQAKGLVRVETADEQIFGAPQAIVALGINQMKAIAFDPPLPPLQALAITRGFDGRAFKVWIAAKGIAPGVLALGGNSGIEFLFAERALDEGTTLLVGFGLCRSSFDPGDRVTLEKEVAKFLPEARVISHDWHNWVCDPFARGTWLATPPDAGASLDAQTWGLQSRLAFASSDFAAREAGWFEGAVVSGMAAAEMLTRQRQNSVEGYT